MSVGDVVTNGEFWGESRTPYLFKVLALDENDVWVRHINGTFEGDALTFKRKFLSAAQEQSQ